MTHSEISGQRRRAHQRYRRERKHPTLWNPRLASAVLLAVAADACGSPRSPRIRVTLQALQVGTQLGCRLVTQGAVLLQRLIDDVVQLQGQDVVVLVRRNRRLGKQRGEDNRRGGPAECLLTGRHLVKHRAEAEEVTARV